MHYNFHLAKSCLTKYLFGSFGSGHRKEQTTCELIHEYAGDGVTGETVKRLTHTNTHDERNGTMNAV